MENFVVSARKYRPASFDMVVGQRSITNTLKNAIKNDHVAQAFLFCGPRGVGKTTCARIMAKTINCENITDNVEACNECQSCVSFNQNNSFNVHELDAASNNSVDDIRSLVDQVRIPTHLGKYKVYVIDEVHMLSQSAFNAFLKTLEEPPSYAKFILATTEKHKIIPTILSRCQIFDFNRITIEDIAKQLEYVANKENVETEYDALHVIAQKADGAMRDALSIFDQMVSFAGNHVTYKAVVENLNVLDYDYFFKVTDHIFQSNVTEILLLYNDIINKGFDGSHFINGFSSHLRNLLVCQNPDTVKLMDVGESVKQRYLEQARMCNTQFLVRALDISNKSDMNYRASNNKRLHVELALIQMTALAQQADQNIQVTASAPVPQNSSNTSKTTSGNKTGNETATKPVTHTTQQKGTDEALQGTEQNAPSVKNQAAGEMIKPKAESSVNEPEKRTTRKRPGAISLDPDKQNEDEKKKDDLNISEGLREKPRNDFTNEEFLTAWNELKKRYQKQNATIFTALNTYEPLVAEKNQIIIKTDNIVQKQGLFEQKQVILSFLREKLKNYSIDFQVKINEKPKQVKAYMPSDKYQKMLMKKPEIGKLKDGLDLEIIF